MYWNDELVFLWAGMNYCFMVLMHFLSSAAGFGNDPPAVLQHSGRSYTPQSWRLNSTVVKAVKISARNPF